MLLTGSGLPRGVVQQAENNINVGTINRKLLEGQSIKYWRDCIK